MIIFPGVYGHWQKYLLDKHKICINCDVHCYDITNTSVIVKVNFCNELVFRKLTVFFLTHASFSCSLCSSCKYKSLLNYVSRWDLLMQHGSSVSYKHLFLISQFHAHLMNNSKHLYKADTYKAGSRRITRG